MASLSHVAPLICGAFLTAAFAQTGPAGHWEGTLQVPDREIHIVLDLSKNDQGAWSGAFSQADGAHNLPLADIKVDDKSAKFRIAAGGANAPDFDCALESAAAMRCTLNTPGGSVTASMKRTGDAARIEPPKPSSAVAVELEGDWEGSIDTPNGALRLVVHFHNQPDKTVKATMDSLDQNATDLPLTDVVQKGSALEFKLPMVGGAYQGTLNKDATQLEGKWTQGGAALPLTLKKAAKK